MPFFYDLTGRALDRGVNDVFEEYDVSSEELLETFAPYMEAISPEVGEAFGFFREQQLYDLDSSEDKISMAYTVELPAYGSAYIYDNRSGMYYDIFTVVHEFGHFNSVYHDDTPALYTNINMDVSEIHSQGLELLFYPYYEQMYPGMGSAMQSTQCMRCLTTYCSAVLSMKLKMRFTAIRILHWKKSTVLWMRLVWNTGLSARV